MSTTIDGIDVSKWQGRIDWLEAHHQLGFVMAKATQGVVEVDSDYARNIAKARRDGLHRGSYHYPNAGDPIAEADYYVEHADRRNGEMQALDFEGAVLELADPVGWAEAWLARVLDRTDNVPLIYMSGSVVHAHDWSRVIKLDAGLWVASWGAKPDPGQWPFVIMWQRDDTGQLRGIHGQVDEDVFYGNAAVWADYANNRHTKGQPLAPTPAPRPAAPAAPAPAPARPPAATPASYVVQAGDYLSRIAAEHHVSVRQLVAWNRHRYPSLGWNPNLIQIGWTLTVSEAS